MVNVYDCSLNANTDYAHIIGRVKYNSRLDYYDGSNSGNGGNGMHLGITRLKKSGHMVLIVGTQWEGAKDQAYIVTDQEALEACLSSGHDEIIDEYPQLSKLYNDLDGE